MIRFSRSAVLLGCGLFACGKANNASSTAATAEKETHELGAFRLTTPKGAKIEDVYKNRQAFSGQGYRVDIEVSADSPRKTMESYKETIASFPSASDVTGQPTERGWEIIYKSSMTSGTAAFTLEHWQYFTFGEQEDAMCIFNEEESKVAIADAICKSIAKK